MFVESAILAGVEDPFTSWCSIFWDCDTNGEVDLLDILLEPGVDLDGTGVPDTCEAQGDLDSDGVVGILDFLGLLVAWRPCTECRACPADLDDDCAVGIADFLALLGNWS